MQGLRCEYTRDSPQLCWFKMEACAGRQLGLRILCCLAVLESLASFTVSKHSLKEFESIPSEQMQHVQTETAMPKVTVMSFNVSCAQAVSRHEVMVYHL